MSQGNITLSIILGTLIILAALIAWASTYEQGNDGKDNDTK